MLQTFLSGPLTLLHGAVWVFFLVVPLIWVDNAVKRRSAATVRRDRETLSRLG